MGRDGPCPIVLIARNALPGHSVRGSRAHEAAQRAAGGSRSRVGTLTRASGACGSPAVPQGRCGKTRRAGAQSMTRTCAHKKGQTPGVSPQRPAGPCLPVGRAHIPANPRNWVRAARRRTLASRRGAASHAHAANLPRPPGAAMCGHGHLPVIQHLVAVAVVHEVPVLWPGRRHAHRVFAAESPLVQACGGARGLGGGLAVRLARHEARGGGEGGGVSKDASTLSSGVPQSRPISH